MFSLRILHSSASFACRGTTGHVGPGRRQNHCGHYGLAAATWARKSSGDRAAGRMTRMQSRIAETASGLFARRADGIRSVAWGVAVLIVVLASVASTSGCGSAASGSGGGTDGGGTDAGSTFHVDIGLATGLVTFPN